MGARDGLVGSVDFLRLFAAKLPVPLRVLRGY